MGEHCIAGLENREHDTP
ncbi:hypothetical protein VCHENC02_0404A, partial [Vibrio harveyi]